LQFALYRNKYRIQLGFVIYHNNLLS